MLHCIAQLTSANSAKADIENKYCYQSPVRGELILLVSSDHFHYEKQETVAKYPVDVV